MIKRFFLVITYLTSFVAFGQDGLPDPNVSPDADCETQSTIIPTCIFERTQPNNALELITGDLKVCSCLKKSNQLFSGMEEDRPSADALKEEKQRKLKAEADKQANLSFLQATTYTSSKKDQDAAILVYGGQEARSKKKEQSVQQKTAPVPLLSERLTKINKIDPGNSSWQCVTYQEYSAQREIPAENNFFQLLREPEFKPENWNINQLRSKFDSSTDEREKDDIRTKITFLSRNPIFMSIMKAEPSEKQSSQKILEKQRELYQILRKLNPDEASTCFTVPNGCLKELHASGKYKEYAASVGSFILNNDVIDISSEQATRDYQRELERLTSGILIDSVPTDPEGYFNYLQSANREISKDCAGPKAQAACYTKFKDHCSHIEAIDQRVKKGLKINSQDLENGLREESNLHVEMDPAANAGFRAFNDKICNDPYRNAAGESLNFFGYQAKYCQGEITPIPECSDRKKLIQKFLNDYSEGEIVADRNLRSSFGTFIADSEFIAVSEAQVAAANNVTESPAELRARFGGLLPSISPSGRLVPTTAGTQTPVRSERSDRADTSTDSITDVAPTTRSSTTTYEDSSVAEIARTDISANSASAFKSSVGTRLPQVSLPEEVSYRPANTENMPVFRNQPQDISAKDLDDEDSVPEIPQSTNEVVKAVQNVKKTVAVGGGSIGSGSSAVTSSGAASKPSGSSAGSSASTSPSFSSRKKDSTKGGLLFKYGLDENKQPEVSLVTSSGNTEVKVDVDRKLMDRIKANPNSLEIGQEDLEEIMASPDAEVKLVLEASEGKGNLVVYAKKDGSGGISFSLSPSKISADKGKKESVRISVLPDVHDNIKADPDVYLNQNTVLMQEIYNKPKNQKLFLQIVSPGKRALIYEVIETEDYIYSFRPVAKP